MKTEIISFALLASVVGCNMPQSDNRGHHIVCQGEKVSSRFDNSKFKQPDNYLHELYLKHKYGTDAAPEHYCADKCYSGK